MKNVIGKGSHEQRLTPSDVQSIVETALSQESLDDKRVLVILPDHRRPSPMDLFFRNICDYLQPRVQAIDFLIASDSQLPMDLERIYRYVGISEAVHALRYPKVRFFNHDALDQASLRELGVLEGSEVAEMTGGVWSSAIPIHINNKALEADFIIIVSPVAPDEGVGFAGGNQNLIPAIAGLDLVETFHWLAAIVTNPVINGVKDTPTRRVVDRAARLLVTPRLCLAFTVDDQHELACLYAGTPEAAWSKAADCSARLHIRYVEKPFRRILGLTPPIYEELWVAGNAMYKLEPIVADDGELVIHGVNVHEVSFAHGPEIERIGYHIRDFFTKQWDQFAGEPKLILAHSANVRGVGRFENGLEWPRITVSLATSIPRATCNRINLGYREIDSIDIEEWKKDPETLVVEEAGQVLYRLGHPPRETSLAEG
ncbi:MAG TPA: lactate racemase domain-containing protein [Polyangiaceae bacterium]